MPQKRKKKKRIEHLRDTGSKTSQKFQLTGVSTQKLAQFLKRKKYQKARWNILQLILMQHIKT